MIFLVASRGFLLPHAFEIDVCVDICVCENFGEQALCVCFGRFGRQGTTLRSITRLFLSKS